MAKNKLYPLYFLVFLIVLYAMTKSLNVYMDTVFPFFRNHFTDLLFIPMQMTVCLIALRFLKRTNKLMIPVSLVLIITFLMAILFEWYLPVYKHSVHQTADVIDALMYAVGAVLFLLIQKIWFQESKTTF